MRRISIEFGYPNTECMFCKKKDGKNRIIYKHMGEVALRLCPDCAVDVQIQTDELLNRM